jgi:hypothetical protein
VDTSKEISRGSIPLEILQAKEVSYAKEMDRLNSNYMGFGFALPGLWEWQR